MIYPLSAMTGGLYRGIAKPLLFRSPPDEVHSRILKLGAWAQTKPVLMNPTKAVLAYHNETYLGQIIDGVYYPNPVGLSAGFDKNFELAQLLKNVGFGFMEGGSLTCEYCEGNARPWFHRLPKTKALVVHAGLANHGAEQVLSHIANYPDGTFEDFPLNISVAKTNSAKTATQASGIKDYIGGLKAVKASGLGKVVTINISCPNAFGGEPFTTPERLQKLLSEVDKVKLKQPVYIKMPIDQPWSKFERLVKTAAKHNVQGLTIGNLAKDRKAMELKDPLSDDIKGGISGPPTRHLSNEMIAKTYKAYGKRFTIVGVGAISSTELAYEKILLGASLLELITGMIYEGPQVIGQINRGLVQRLKQDGYDNISQAVGRGL